MFWKIILKNWPQMAILLELPASYLKASVLTKLIKKL